MPDRKKPRRMYDLNELRKKYPPFSFVEGRRCYISIYDAFVRELYEAGCMYAARKLNWLANTEHFMYKTNIIRHQLFEDHALLLALIENAKNAEMAYHITDCGGHTACLELLRQNILLLEPLGLKYDWLLRRFYDISCKISKWVQGKFDSTDEIIAFIYYKFASYLSTNTVEYELAIDILTTALDLVRAKMWYIRVDSDHSQTLHQAVCKTSAQVRIQLSKQVARQDIQLAIQLSKEATINLGELGANIDKPLMCDSYLALGNYLIENDQLAEAIKAFNNIKLYADANVCSAADDSPFIKISCQMYISLAACYLSLNELNTANENIFKGLCLAKKFKFQRMEAEAQLLVGKLKSKIIGQLHNAKEAYEEAKKIFTELGDLNNTKKAIYLIAKLKADAMFPKFVEMLRSSPVDACRFYSLRKWKNQCEPFWDQPNDETQSRWVNDKIHCLLNEPKIVRSPDASVHRRLITT